MKGWLYLLLMLFAPAAFAGPFDPPSTDQSVNLLGVIFSGSVGSIYLGASPPNPVLTDLMEKFNFIIVVVGTVVVSYVAILSTINTAHEGSAMGKKWSAVWIPMRSVAGMALLVPAPSTGYSMIQVTVMWIVLQGIGAADSLWNIALDGLASGVSATAGTGGNTGNNTFVALLANNASANLVPQIMNMSICQQTFNVLANSPSTPNGSFAQQYGNSITQFYVTSPSSPAPIPDTKASANGKTETCYKFSGTFYMGVQDTNPAHNDVCGSLPVEATVCPSEFKSETPSPAQLINYAQDVYFGKLNALSQMLDTLKSTAIGYATGQYGSVNTTSAPQAPGGAVAKAANAYANAMVGQVVPNAAQFTQPTTTQSAINGNNPTSTAAGIAQAIQQGEDNGWISAGSFYFIFNRTLISTIYDTALHDQMPGNVTAPACATGSNCYKGLSSGNAQPETATDLNNLTLSAQQNTVAQNLALGSDYVAHDTKQVAKTLNFTPPGGGGGGTSISTALDAFTAFGDTIAQELFDLFNNIGCANITQTQSGTVGTASNCGTMDPLLAHSIFGRDIMLGCEAVFLTTVAALVATVGLIFASSGLAWIIGAGPGLVYSIATGLFWTGMLTLGVLFIIFPLLAFLWAEGAMLAIYCPLIPFMIFTMGALGWMLTVVEAIIAAPLIALGLVMPAGDELGKLEHALMILANIFLRPMLMIFGFILSAGVYRAIVQLIDFGMGAVFQTISVSTMFSFVVVIVIYITFIISVTSVAFSLIYAVPDRILRWLGGPNESTDVGNLKEVKGAAQAASKETGKGIQEMSQKSLKASGDTISGTQQNIKEGKGLSSGFNAAGKALFGSGGGGGGGNSNNNPPAGGNNNPPAGGNNNPPPGGNT